jgi:hypothetical protein
MIAMVTQIHELVFGTPPVAGNSNIVWNFAPLLYVDAGHTG